jgi:hypothetical protein
METSREIVKYVEKGHVFIHAVGLVSCLWKRVDKDTPAPFLCLAVSFGPFIFHDLLLCII